jgi:hypothetical protein
MDTIQRANERVRLPFLRRIALARVLSTVQTNAAVQAQQQETTLLYPNGLSAMDSPLPLPLVCTGVHWRSSAMRLPVSFVTCTNVAGEGMVETQIHRASLSDVRLAKTHTELPYQICRLQPQPHRPPFQVVKSVLARSTSEQIRSTTVRVSASRHTVAIPSE